MQYFNVYRKFTGERIATVFCNTKLEAIHSAAQVLRENSRWVLCSELESDGETRVVRNSVGDYVRLPDGVLCKRVR